MATSFRPQDRSKLFQGDMGLLSVPSTLLCYKMRRKYRDSLT